MIHSRVSPFTRIALAIASATLASMLLKAAAAAQFTVNTLDGGSGVSGACALADAIRAHNNPGTSITQCGTGTGNDQIQFSVSGKITIINTLLVGDGALTITGPGPSSSSLVIDGLGGTPPNIFQREVLRVDKGAMVTIDTLSIDDGDGVFVDGPVQVTTNGAGIFNSGMLTVRNSSFFNNGTMDLNGICFTAAGGAIYNDVGASLSVTNSSFDFNCAGDGGGIFNKSTQPVTVSNSTFRANTGEAIFNDLGATLIINSNSKFDSNKAGPQFPTCICAGGGLFNKGEAMIDNVSFLAFNSATIGGGIYNVNSLTITNSSFSNNNATFGGGIANVPELALSEGINATVTIEGSTLSGNQAAGDGEGIFNDGGEVVLKNSVTFC